MQESLENLSKQIQVAGQDILTTLSDNHAEIMAELKKFPPVKYDLRPMLSKQAINLLKMAVDNQSTILTFEAGHFQDPNRIIVQLMEKKLRLKLDEPHYLIQDLEALVDSEYMNEVQTSGLLNTRKFERTRIGEQFIKNEESSS